MKSATTERTGARQGTLFSSVCENGENPYAPRRRDDTSVSTVVERF
jgi:hypothetical protein